MSDPMSALPGAKFDGSVAVAEAGLCGMITLRGDLSAAKLKTAVKKLTGVAVPDTGLIALKGANGVAWMSPDELLILTPYRAVDKAALDLSAALKSVHHLVANVSDARAVFTVTGPQGRDVLAKLAPADLSPASFKSGQIRRSRLAQVPAAFWFAAPDQIQVVCFRSVGEYVFNLLKNAASPDATVKFH